MLPDSKICFCLDQSTNSASSVMPGTGLSSLSILHNVAPSTPVHNARDPHALLPGTPGSDASTTNTGGRVIAFIPPALMLKSFLKLPKAGLQGPKKPSVWNQRLQHNTRKIRPRSHPPVSSLQQITCKSIRLIKHASPATPSTSAMSNRQV